MIIAFAGLPGSGKSYFAHILTDRYKQFVVLDKDIIRSVLFPGILTEYSSTQDDFCIAVILQSAGMIIKRNPEMHIVIDGRTFSKGNQVAQVCHAAEHMGIAYKFVQFICDDETIKKRLALQANTHLAKNRDYTLYRRLKEEAEPLLIPHLTLYSDEAQEEKIRKFLEYIDGKTC